MPRGWITATLLGATLVAATTVLPLERGSSVRAGTVSRAASASPAFESSVIRIDRATKALMTGRSWRPGCPLPIRDLRYLTLRHHTFDGGTRMGELVVHEQWADRMVRVFEGLYDIGFPIRRMVLVDHYGANDTRSMKHDNTSAFNCRERAGSPGVWSEHAYGKAIDVNPVENPYFVPPDYVSPPNGQRYLDRSKRAQGMIHAHDDVVKAFADIGWAWGGNWNNIKDWQHFSANGR